MCIPGPGMEQILFLSIHRKGGDNCRIIWQDKSRLRRTDILAFEDDNPGMAIKFLFQIPINDPYDLV